MIKNLLLILVVLFIISSCTDKKNPANSIVNESNNLFPNGNFEDDYYGWYVDYNTDAYFDISMIEPQEGIKCAKISLGSDGKRAEILRDNCAEEGTEMRYVFYVKIDSNYTDRNASQIIQQFHYKPDIFSGETWATIEELPPVVRTEYRYNKLNVIAYQDATGEEILGAFSISKNEWIKIEYQCYWSQQTDGFVKVSVNDQSLETSNDSNKFYLKTLRNSIGNLFQFGLDRDQDIKDSVAVYFDDFTVTMIEQ